MNLLSPERSEELRRFAVRLCKRLNREVGGQALIETAVVLPFLLSLAFNTVNFGYFFLMTVNLAAAPRSAPLFLILGASTTAATVPRTSAVKTLFINDLTGAV